MVLSCLGNLAQVPVQWHQAQCVLFSYLCLEIAWLVPKYVYSMMMHGHLSHIGILCALCLCVWNIVVLHESITYFVQFLLTVQRAHSYYTPFSIATTFFWQHLIVSSKTPCQSTPPFLPHTVNFQVRPLHFPSWNRLEFIENYLFLKNVQAVHCRDISFSLPPPLVVLEIVLFVCDTHWPSKCVSCCLCGFSLFDRSLLFPSFFWLSGCNFCELFEITCGAQKQIC